MNQIVAPSSQHTLQLGTAILPYLADHRIGEAIVMPAAAYLELVLAVGISVTRGQPCVLEEVQFQQPLFLGPQLVTVRISLWSLSRALWRFEIESATDGGANWIVHAVGQLHATELPPRPKPMALPKLLDRCVEQYTAAEHLAAMQARRINYGPSFQVVQTISRRDGEALAQLQLPQALQSEAQFYRIHPVLLDGAIQSIASTRLEDIRPALPVAVASLAVYQRPRSRLWCHVVVDNCASDGPSNANLTLADESGVVVAVLRGVCIQPVSSPRPMESRAVGSVVTGAKEGAASDPALENRLSAIWKDVLGLRQLENNDRFSDLGGDSITATQIADKAKRAGIDVTPQVILETQTISNLVGTIIARKKELTS